MSEHARDRRVLWILAGVWVLALFGVPFLGDRVVSPAELLAGDEIATTIFWKLRVPRVLLALVAGGGLAMAGAVLQTLFGNPLAEPYTLGVAGGAALGAVVAMRIAETLVWVAAGSFFGALSVAGVLVALAASRYGRDRSTLLLAGIAISLSCSAVILFLQYLGDFAQTFRVVRWMMGGLAVVGFTEVGWAGLWVALGFLTVLAHRWELNLLLAGEEVAVSRGVEVDRVRWVVLGVVSVFVGALVAVVGPIGFVGLIVPHALRRLMGHDHLVLVPATVLAGGVFLASSDLIGRWIMAPAELPVGIVTALVGGPFFFWILLKTRR